MSFDTPFEVLKFHLARRHNRPHRRQSGRRYRTTARPWLERLDGRCLLSNYSVTDLRQLANLDCEANDLNDAGQVVGIAYGSNAARAVLWNETVVIDLGTLGGSSSGAHSINNVGQIVGWATSADGSSRGFLINPEDSDGDNVPDRWFRDLDADGANDLMVALPMARAHGINSRGQVVGNDFADNYLWTPITPNGTAGSLLALDLYPAAINDSGQIAGSASINGVSHAVLWQDGVTTDLGYGAGNDINASGQVVGSTYALNQGFLWTPNVPNGAVGTLSYLESLFDPSLYDPRTISSAALGLNNAGQVVGESLVVSHGGWGEGGYDISRASATLWAGGGPQSLGDLAVPGVYLINARAINDSGQIIAHKFVYSYLYSYYPIVLSPITATAPELTVSDTTVTEGNTGTRAATFTVTLSAASSQAVTVAYTTADGTAISGTDYQAASGTLTFGPGEISRTITVQVAGDRIPEPHETLFVNLISSVNASIADGQGVGTIVDDEPRVSISDVSMLEGKKGTTKLFTFTVTLSVAYDQPVTMSYMTVNGTATTSGGDYAGKSGTLKFAPGETTKTITVKVKGDATMESDEAFYLDLFGLSSNALFWKKRGIGTILNDD